MSSYANADKLRPKKPPSPPEPPPVRYVNDDKRPSNQPLKHSALNLPADYWRHRRAMTWLAVLAGLFLFPLLGYFKPALFELAPAFYSLVTVIVAAYMSTAVLDDKWKKEKP